MHCYYNCSPTRQAMIIGSPEHGYIGYGWPIDDDNSCCRRKYRRRHPYFLPYPCYPYCMDFPYFPHNPFHYGYWPDSDDFR